MAIAPTKGPRRRGLVALIAAFALHLLLLASWPRRPALRPPPPASPRPHLRLLDKASMAKARQHAQPAGPVTPPGPVLDLPKPKQPQRPKVPRYAAEHDTFAEQESKSRHAQLQPKAVAQEATQAQPSAAAAPGATAPQAVQQRGNEAPQPTGPAHAPLGQHKGGMPALALKIAPARAHKANDSGQTRERAAPGGPRRVLSMRDLLPSLGRLAQIDAAPMADLVDETVAEGETTQINAAAFRFASFNNRLKERVAGHWRPLEALERRGDGDGTSLGNRDCITVLRVGLDANGMIFAMETVRSAGVAVLDEAARTAFYEAQPFSHPPRAMLDANGRVSVNFGFSLQAHADSLFSGFARP